MICTWAICYVIVLAIETVGTVVYVKYKFLFKIMSGNSDHDAYCPY